MSAPVAYLNTWYDATRYVGPKTFVSAVTVNEEDGKSEPLFTGAQLEWIFANCRIIYFPPGNEYPVEHSMLANKDMRAELEKYMPAAR